LLENINFEQTYTANLNHGDADLMGMPMENPEHMYKEDNNNKVPTPEQEDSKIMVDEQSGGDKETADTNNFDEENQVQTVFQKKLRSENPVVNSATIGYINDYESFVREYDRQHPDKIYRCWHFWGLINLLIWVAYALTWVLWGNLYKFLGYALFGLVTGFMLAHTLPTWLRKQNPVNIAEFSGYYGGCRCCFFSWDVFKRPKWVWKVQFSHSLLH